MTCAVANKDPALVPKSIFDSTEDKEMSCGNMVGGVANKDVTSLVSKSVSDSTETYDDMVGLEIKIGEAQHLIDTKV